MKNIEEIIRTIEDIANTIGYESLREQGTPFIINAPSLYQVYGKSLPVKEGCVAPKFLPYPSLDEIKAKVARPKIIFENSMSLKSELLFFLALARRSGLIEEIPLTRLIRDIFEIHRVPYSPSDLVTDKMGAIFSCEGQHPLAAIKQKFLNEEETVQFIKNRVGSNKPSFVNNWSLKDGSNVPLKDIADVGKAYCDHVLYGFSDEQIKKVVHATVDKYSHHLPRELSRATVDGAIESQDITFSKKVMFWLTFIAEDGLGTSNFKFSHADMKDNPASIMTSLNELKQGESLSFLMGPPNHFVAIYRSKKNSLDGKPQYYAGDGLDSAKNGSMSQFFQALEGACNLHIMQQLPNQKNAYRNSYLFCTESKALFYIKDDGTEYEVKLTNQEAFHSVLNGFGSACVFLNPEKKAQLFSYFEKDDDKKITYLSLKGISSNKMQSNPMVAGSRDHYLPATCHRVADLWGKLLEKAESDNIDLDNKELLKTYLSTFDLTIAAQHRLYAETFVLGKPFLPDMKKTFIKKAAIEIKINGTVYTKAIEIDTRELLPNHWKTYDTGIELKNGEGEVLKDETGKAKTLKINVSYEGNFDLLCHVKNLDVLEQLGYFESASSNKIHATLGTGKKQIITAIKAEGGFNNRILHQVIAEVEKANHPKKVYSFSRVEKQFEGMERSAFQSIRTSIEMLNLPEETKRTLLEKSLGGLPILKKGEEDSSQPLKTKTRGNNRIGVHSYMVYGDGGTLSTNTNNPTHPSMTLFTGQQIKNCFTGLLGLMAIGQGHHDIKPDNIVKVGDDFTLIDFGLAKKTKPALNQQMDQSVIDLNTKGRGTRGYLFPGDQASSTDRKNLYSFFLSFLWVYSKESPATIDKAIEWLDNNPGAYKQATGKAKRKLIVETLRNRLHQTAYLPNDRMIAEYMLEFIADTLLEDIPKIRSSDAIDKMSKLLDIHDKELIQLAAKRVDNEPEVNDFLKKIEMLKNKRQIVMLDENKSKLGSYIAHYQGRIQGLLALVKENLPKEHPAQKLQINHKSALNQLKDILNCLSDKSQYYDGVVSSCIETMDFYYTHLTSFVNQELNELANEQDKKKLEQFMKEIENAKDTLRANDISLLTREMQILIEIENISKKAALFASKALQSKIYIIGDGIQNNLEDYTSWITKLSDLYTPLPVIEQLKIGKNEKPECKLLKILTVLEREHPKLHSTTKKVCNSLYDKLLSNIKKEINSHTDNPEILRKILGEIKGEGSDGILRKEDILPFSEEILKLLNNNESEALKERFKIVPQVIKKFGDEHKNNRMIVEGDLIAQLQNDISAYENYTQILISTLMSFPVNGGFELNNSMLPKDKLLKIYDKLASEYSSKEKEACDELILRSMAIHNELYEISNTRIRDVVNELIKKAGELNHDTATIESNLKSIRDKMLKRAAAQGLSVEDADTFTKNIADVLAKIKFQRLEGECTLDQKGLDFINAKLVECSTHLMHLRPELKAAGLEIYQKLLHAKKKEIEDFIDKNDKEKAKRVFKKLEQAVFSCDEKGLKHVNDAITELDSLVRDENLGGDGKAMIAQLLNDKKAWIANILSAKQYEINPSMDIQEKWKRTCASLVVGLNACETPEDQCNFIATQRSVIHEQIFSKGPEFIYNLKMLNELFNQLTSDKDKRKAYLFTLMDDDFELWKYLMGPLREDAAARALFVTKQIMGMSSYEAEIVPFIENKLEELLVAHGVTLNTYLDDFLKREQKQAMMVRYRGEFNNLLGVLRSKTDELRDKARSTSPNYNRRYETVGQVAENLIRSIEDAGEVFFNGSLSPESYRLFKTAITAAVTNSNIQEEFSKHRSSIVVRAASVIGEILFKFLKLITAIMAIIEISSDKKGAAHGLCAFFALRKTDSANKLEEFGEDFENLSAPEAISI